MTKAKWVHKISFRNSDDWVGVSCNINTASYDTKWAKVTCPKCLAKKPKRKKEKTNLFFEMEGKVSIVERQEDGIVISQEEIDGEVVLKCLVSLLERAMKTELDLDKICEYNCKIIDCECKNNEKDNNSR